MRIVYGQSLKQQQCLSAVKLFSSVQRRISHSTVTKIVLANCHTFSLKSSTNNLIKFNMAAEKPHYNASDAPALFEKFVKDHNRVYTDETDRKNHYEAFVRNLEKINQLNSQGTATYDINKFADYTEEERKSMFGLRKN